MKKPVLIMGLLFTLILPCFAVSVENVELWLPSNWKVKTSQLSSASLLLVAGIPTQPLDLFVMQSQNKTKDADVKKHNPNRPRDFTLKADFDDGNLNPILNVYKIQSLGKSDKDYMAAETLSFRVKAGSKVLESKDNYIVVSYQDGMRDIKQVEYFYIKDDMLYVLLFAASQKTFDGFRHLFDQINQSLKIK
jgi:hypothetical protein